jgi:DNA repair exonuclease SbcCD ATPase subunit
MDVLKKLSPEQIMDMLQQFLKMIRDLGNSSSDYNSKENKTQADMDKLLEDIGASLKDPALLTKIQEIDPSLADAIRRDAFKIDNPAELERLIHVFSEMRAYTNDSSAIRALDEVIQALSTAKAQMEKLQESGGKVGKDDFEFMTSNNYRPMMTSPGGYQPTSSA